MGYSFTYDDAGNRLSRCWSHSDTLTGLCEFYSYDANNRLLSRTHESGLYSHRWDFTRNDVGLVTHVRVYYRKKDYSGNVGEFRLSEVLRFEYEHRRAPDVEVE